MKNINKHFARRLARLLTLVTAIAVILASIPVETYAATPTINAKVLHMQAGQSYTLKVSGLKNVKWASSNTKVAKVKKGKVTALKAGKATITAKKGKKKLKCSVIVASGKKKTLVIYFSATGTTRKAAIKVQKAANADIVRIYPKKAYTSKDLNYNKNCRANSEQNKNSKVAIATVVRDLRKYDNIYLGYPIWWGKEPGVIRTFLSKNNLKGKTILPFCTSGGSGISGSMKHIRSLSKGATVTKGMDLTDASAAEVKEWVTKNTPKKPEETTTDQNQSSEDPAQTSTEQNQGSVDPAEQTTGKTLVAYFSRTGSTKSVAEKIAQLTGADTYEITAKDPYTDADINYSDSSSRATREQNDQSVRPEIGSAPISLTQYDTIYVGYPIWWGQEPRIMDTFVESYDFTGITVIPFCTSASSGIGSSGTNLAKNAGTGTWLEGKRFSGSASATEIETWITSIQQ